MKRKDPPKSPAATKEKKSKSPATEKISIEEQRRRAIEWAEKLKAETKVAINESIQNNTTKKTKTPSKSSTKEDKPIKSRSSTPILKESRSKESIETTEEEEPETIPTTETKIRAGRSKTPSKAKKNEVVIVDEVEPKSTKKVTLIKSPPLSSKKNTTSKVTLAATNNKQSISFSTEPVRDVNIHPASDVMHLIPLEPKSFSWLWLFFNLIVLIIIAGFMIIKIDINVEEYLPSFFKVGIPSIILANIISALKRLYEIFNL